MPAAHIASSAVNVLLRWLGLAAVTAAAAVLLDLAGMPSASLFAALLVGLAAALAPVRAPEVPVSVFRAAQALTGVSLGAYVQSSSLHAVARAWLPVTFVSAATLVLSLACGWVLVKTRGLSPPTAVLGMVAGGASGIVGMADELGADDRLVAIMQYLRVLVIVMLTPILVGAAFPHPHSSGAGASASAPVIGSARDWGLMLAALLVGAAVAAATRMPAGSLLGPMIAAAVVTLAIGKFHEPTLLREPAFAAIGLQVGLRFTPEMVRAAGRLLLPSLACVAGLLVACFGLGVILHLSATNVSLLDGYLATTPGGLYAVLAAAFGTGTDTTFVIAVQTLRLFVMVLLAPLVVRRLVRPSVRARRAPR